MIKIYLPFHEVYRLIKATLFIYVWTLEQSSLLFCLFSCLTREGQKVTETSSRGAVSGFLLCYKMCVTYRPHTVLT